jgi:hypothetical protein
MALIAIQSAFFIGMYYIRKRYKRSRDLRAGVILTGIYGLLIGLAGMHYAARLGLAGVSTLDENYLGFSVFMVVVIAIGVGLLSALKPARRR